MSPTPRTPHPGAVAPRATDLSALARIATVEDLGQHIAAEACARTGADEAEVWLAVDDERVRSLASPLVVRRRAELGFGDLPCAGSAAVAPGGWRGKLGYRALPLRWGDALVGVLALGFEDDAPAPMLADADLALWALALDRLQATAAAARSDAASVTRVGAGLAHTLSNVVQAAMSSIETARYAPAPVAQKAALDDARAVLRRAAVLVQQLGVLGGRADSPMPTEVRELVAGLVAALRLQMPREIKLEFESGPEDCWVLIDRGTIEATLAGLVYATRELLGAAGTIRVTTRVAAPHGAASSPGRASLVPPAPEGGRSVVIEVQRGPGATRPALPLGSVRPGSHGGDSLGAGNLGLTFARAAVSRYGGEVFERTLVSGAASIAIVLPELRQVPNARASGTRPAVGHGRHRILVADDEPAVLRSVARLLRSAGHDVVTAPDGTQALTEARAAEGLQVALLDLTMPGLAGPALVASLRRAIPGLPVVIMTGYASDEMVDALRREGVAVVLRKPVSLQALLTAIEHALAT